MPDEQMRNRPEEYEETEDSRNPPAVTGSAPAVVAGMWYVLAPVGIIVLLLFVLLLYWFGPDPAERDAVEPTTGIEQRETTPGGGDPIPSLDTPEREREFRGGGQ